jgi:hypothetical protein
MENVEEVDGSFPVRYPIAKYKTSLSKVDRSGV